MANLGSFKDQMAASTHSHPPVLIPLASVRQCQSSDSGFGVAGGVGGGGRSSGEGDLYGRRDIFLVNHESLDTAVLLRLGVC
jgi:hypothetical protein